MSGASPRTVNSQTDTYPGCQHTPVVGSPGEETWFINPTGDDCSTGTEMSADWFNGVGLSLNCIMTQGGTKPLPLNQLCANPCDVWDSISEYTATYVDEALENIEKPRTATTAEVENILGVEEVRLCLNTGEEVMVNLAFLLSEILPVVLPGALCSIPRANAAEINSIDENTTVIGCFNGQARQFTLTESGINSNVGQGFGTQCDDGYPVGTTYQAPGGGFSSTFVGQIASGTELPPGATGVWVITVGCDASGTEGDCVAPVIQKTSCV